MKTKLLSGRVFICEVEVFRKFAVTFCSHLVTDSYSNHSFIISEILSGEAVLLIGLIILRDGKFTDSFKISLLVL